MVHRRHRAVWLFTALTAVACSSTGGSGDTPSTADGGGGGASSSEPGSGASGGGASSSGGAALPCDDAGLARSVDHCGACGVRCRDDQLCRDTCIDAGGSGTSCADPLNLPQDDDEYGLRFPVAGGPTRRPPCGPMGAAPVRWLRFTARQGHTLNGIEVGGGGPDIKVTIAAYLTPSCDDASLPLCSFERDPVARNWPTVEPKITSGQTVWVGVFVDGTPTEPLFVRVDD